MTLSVGFLRFVGLLGSRLCGNGEKPVAALMLGVDTLTTACMEEHTVRSPLSRDCVAGEGQRCEAAVG